MKVLFSFLIMLVPLAACSQEHAVVARVGNREIRRDEISCKQDVARTDDAQCRRSEQLNLNRIMMPLLLAEACRLNNIKVTDDDVRAAVPTAARPSTEAFAKGADRARMIVRAVIKVRQGANMAATWEHDLRANDVSMPQFESALRAYPTAGKAEEFLQTDVAATMQQQVIGLYRERLEKKRISELISNRSRREGVALDIARQQFWQNVIRQSNATVSDSTLKLPDMEGFIP